MKIAAVQAAPVFLDRTATTEKVLSLMTEAAGNGAELAAFPETFLSGYPIWVELTGGAAFDDPDQKRAYAAYLEGAVRLGGPEMAEIIQKSAELNLFTYLGLTERSVSGGTVYCSLAAVDPALGLVSLHRKLMPTYEERLVWGTGDGAGLRVHDYQGWRIGGLNCWENWMPLARQAMYAQGEQLHIAVWPGSAHLTGDISRFVAREGRVYVLSAGGVLSLDDIPDSFPLKNSLAAVTEKFKSGGSCLIAPNGEPVFGPLEDEEGIFYGEIDLATVRGERQNFDPAGHYNRADVFDLRVCRKRLAAAEFSER